MFLKLMVQHQYGFPIDNCPKLSVTGQLTMNKSELSHKVSVSCLKICRCIVSKNVSVSCLVGELSCPAVLQLDNYSRAQRPVALFQRPAMPFFINFIIFPIIW